MSEEKKMTLRDTIEPKSDQLNYDDVMTGPITDTVEGLAMGNAEQPVIVRLQKHRDYKPCKSMRRVLIAAWGDKGKDWIGKQLTLVGDPDVRFGGVAVGGVRISHLSGIDKPMTIKLTTTRSKRADYVVQPLPRKNNQEPVPPELEDGDPDAELESVT
jgi:hypothetical protein